MLSGATLDLLSKSPGAHLPGAWSLTMPGSAGEHLPSCAPDSHLHDLLSKSHAGASVGRGQRSLRVTCAKG